MQKLSWQWHRSVESPWFYAAWFCLFGAAMLFVAHGKYGERQSGIERRFQARSQPAHQPVDQQAASTYAESGQDLYSTPDDTVIPLWPLAALLALLSGLAAGLTVRAGFARQSEIDEE